MATVQFQTGPDYNRQIFRVTYSVTTSGNQSTVSISKVEVATNGYAQYAWLGSFILKIGSTTIFTATTQSGNATVTPTANNLDVFTEVKTSGNSITGSATITRSTGAATSTTISIEAQGGAQYPYFLVSTSGYPTLNFTGTNSAAITLPAITYTLSISAGTGSSITVKRGSTTLSDGATITYGDSLTISFASSTGYNLGTHTVNGSTFTSGNTHTVTGAVSVVSTASLKTFTLSISAGTGSSITVKRGSTTLSNGSTITYGDSLVITFTASTGYAIATHTVNGTTFTSGGTKTVDGDVSVVSTATSVKSTLAASNGTFGTAQTLTVTRYSTAYTHTITYSCAGYTGTIVNKGTSTSIEWTPLYDIVNGIPSATSASCVLTITTYSGSTSLGANTTTITLSVPAWIRPSPSLSVSDARGYASTYGGYVQGQSKAAVTVTDGNQYSATTASRSTTANGATYTAASFTTGALVSAGTNTISTTVKDSRGRTGSASTSITVLAYTAPSISSFGVHRTDSTGTADNNGEYFVCSYSVSITALNNHNGKILYMYYRKTGGSWTSVNIPLSTYSQSGTTSPIAISTDSSYEVELSLADDFSTITRSTTLSTTPSVISFKAKGKGAAFGKAAEEDNLLDVAWNMRVRGNLTVDGDGAFVRKGGAYVHYANAGGASSGYIKIAVITVLSSNLNAPIAFTICQRGLPIPTTVYLTFHNDSTRVTWVEYLYGTGSSLSRIWVDHSDAYTFDIWVQKNGGYDNIGVIDYRLPQYIQPYIRLDWTDEFSSTQPTGIQPTQI